MHVKLSPRLAVIANLIPQGSVVADIGTDHAYLPVFLMTQKISPRVIAADLHEKPLAAAIELIETLNYNNKIITRQGDGLRVIEPGEADVIVIAGMGGGTIAHILEESPEVLTSVNRIILQPMTGASRVRIWLMENDFSIVEEELIEDDGIIYEIIAAEHGKAKYSQTELLIGPQLLKNKPSLLLTYLKQLCKHIEKILTEMELSNSEETEQKKKEFQVRLEKLKQVMTCL